MFSKKKKAEELIEESEVLTEKMTGELPDVPEEAKKAKKKLPGWVILPILLVIALIFFGASKLSGGSTKITQFPVVEVQKGEIKEVYNTSGLVESEKTKVFYSPVNAPVMICNAKVGQPVKAGDVLVTYDTSNLARDNQQSELNALSAKYTNQDAIEQSSRAAQNTAEAQAKTAAAISDLQDRIQKKQKEVDQLKIATAEESGKAAETAAAIAQLQEAKQTNENTQTEKEAEKENIERQLASMAAEDPGHKALMDQAEALTTEIGNLKNEHRSLEQQLASIGSTAMSDTAQTLAGALQELESMKVSLTELQNNSVTSADTGITSAQKKNMQISENLAELAQMSTEELLAKGQEGIKAEFDGIISDVKAIEGSDAMQGQELFTIVSSQDVVVELEVSANDFDNLTEGNQATVKIGKQTYHGTLETVDKIALPNAKGNPVIGAKVHIDDPDEKIYIGVTAKVAMTVAEKKNVLCLPNEVVNTSTDGDFVYVIENGTVRKQMVELGVASSSEVEIISGLKEGSQVVSSVSADITEGMKATGILEEAKESGKE